MTTIQDSVATGYTPRRKYEILMPPVAGYAGEPFPPYWTWRRLSMFVMAMKDGRSLTPGEWQALHREIPSLSPAKRIWLYQQLKLLFSPDAMSYLFGGWKPSASVVDLDMWL
jgi:hypothetical protein